MDNHGVHRPRDVDWKRAAGLLYGDWGTSKAYVIGFAFSGGVAAVGYKSLPIIIAISVLTALVAYCYTIVCKHYPDGGGVYSAARDQSRVLAAMGALLLVADLTVTAAMSGWSGIGYLGVHKEWIRTVTLMLILLIGVLNSFGPKHSGSLAAAVAIPMVLVVFTIIGLSIPHLTTRYLEPADSHFSHDWLAFTGMILTLSGVEAIANLTGVMKLDKGASAERPSVVHTSRLSIFIVTVEVVVGTVLLGWAMLSLPKDLEATVLHPNWENMLRVLAEQYGNMTVGLKFGTIFGHITGIVVGVLLLSAVNTAIGAMIGQIYMLARDGEMPRAFTKLNSHGVPFWPLLIATALPLGVVSFASNLESLMGLYAIGVVGAITVNLGCSAFNRRLPLPMHERVVLAITFLLLLAVEITIARTKPDALFFAVCVLGLGFALRAYSLKRAGLKTLTVSEQVAASVAPEHMPDFKLNLSPGQSILVAARGVTPVLRYAIEEARLRGATLYVLYVKQIAVTLPGPVEKSEKPRWQDDAEANRIMYWMLEKGKENDVMVIPLYTVSENPAASILDLSATIGVDYVMLGASHRKTLLKLLKGSVVIEVAESLPESIQLVIHG